MKSCLKTCDPSTCPGCPLKAPSLLRNLDQHSLDQMKKVRRSFGYEKGERLPTHLDGKPGFHIIKSGKVKVSYGRPQAKTIRIDGPSCLTGFAEAKYETGSVEALEMVTACFFSFADTSRIVQFSQQLTENLSDCVSRSLLHSQRHSYILSKTTVKSRVVGLLVGLMTDFGVSSPHGLKIDLRADRRTLAELAGTATESFSRTITELEKAGILLREGWALHVLDSSALIKLMTDSA